MEIVGYIILIALATVPLLQIAHTKWMQPKRIEFAETGRSLLNGSMLSAKEKVLVNDLLDDAFKWHFPLLMAILVTPILVFVGISKAIGAEIPRSPAYKALTDSPQGRKFVDLHMLCVLWSNPPASLLVLIQALPIMIFYSFFAGSRRAAKSMFEVNVVGYMGTARRV